MSTKGRASRQPKRNRMIGAAAAAASAITLLQPSFAFSANVTSTWRVGSGNWSDPSRWSNVPAVATFPNNGNLGNSYDAILNTSGAISTTTLDTNVTLNSLTLSGVARLSGASGTSGRSINIASDFTFADNSGLSVPVNIPAGATLHLTGIDGVKQFTGSITLGGIASVANEISRGNGVYQVSTGQGPKTVPFKIESNGVFTANRGVVFFVPDTTGEFYGGTAFGQFENAGLIDVYTGSSFTLSTGWFATNSGNIRVNSPLSIGDVFLNTGTIDLQSASASATFWYGGTISGSVRLAPGATLTFRGNGRAAHWLSNLSLTNAGTINLGAGSSVNIATPLTVGGVINLATSTARLTLSAPAVFTGPMTLDGGGTIAGTARLTASDFSFKSGTLDTTELLISGGGVLNLSGGGDRHLAGSKITVQGTANWRTGWVDSRSAASNRVQVSADGTLNVSGTAAVSLKRSYTFAGAQSDLLDNAGLVNFDHASFSAGNSWDLNNTGTIRATASSIAFASAVTNAGSIELFGGSTAQFNSKIGARFNISSLGRLSIEAGSGVTFADPITGPPTLANAGVIEAGGALALQGLWNLSNSGIIRASSTFSLTSRSVTNSGVIDLGSGCGFSMNPSGGTAKFSIEGGGRLSVHGSAQAQFSSGGGSAGQNLLSNAGLIDLSDGGSLTLSQSWRVSSSGTVRVGTGTLSFFLNLPTSVGSIDLGAGGGVVVKNDFNTLLNTRSLVGAGYHNGAWDGAGLRVEPVQFGGTGFGVGYVRAGDVGIPAGVWHGVGVAPLDVVAICTIVGDANLDGVVDFVDLVHVAQNYNLSNKFWFDGDFDYNGTVDFSDLVKLAQNYNLPNPPDPVPGTTADFAHDVAAAFASVPEPSGLMSFLGLCALSQKRRAFQRRRR